MSDTGPMIESWMCAVLRGESLASLGSIDADHLPGLRVHAGYHGVGPLLAHRLEALRRCGVPVEEFPFSARDLKEALATELIREHELIRVLDALATSGIVALLLKGSALAYSVYPSPALRPRADTDLLIRSSDRDVTARTLAELGYEKRNAVSGELVAYQCGYAMRDRFHVDHVLDVHWRLSNTQTFSRAFDYQELEARSVPVPALGDHARALAPADALLHACMHRVHHFHSPYCVGGVRMPAGDRLIWIHDLHLLIESMSHRELVEFAEMAGSKNMRTICSDGLIEARRCFGTKIPREILASLAEGGAAEPSARHLRRGRARHFLTELRSLPHWKDRFALLGEHLFPPADYMLEKYAATSRVWLPMLYLQRGIHGAWKRIQSP